MLARLVLVSLLLTGCEKTDHGNIDKWLSTQKGATKLKKALTDPGIDPDLSAHAGANLVKRGADPEVRAAFETMEPARRSQVIGKLAPRLWEQARVEDELRLPAPPQVTAKDMLFTVRAWADAASKQQIDGYLLDYYGVASYEGRARDGAVLGATVIRAIGPEAGKKLTSVVNRVIAAPGQDKTKNRISDELMLGLAASGSPEAVSYVLDIARMDRGDAKLPQRALDALFKAYVDPGGLFDIVPPEPLVPNLDKLVAIVRDTAMPGEVIDDALALIRAIGGTPCYEQLRALIAVPHRGRFKYVASTQALRCGGAAVIGDIVRALPEAGAYQHEELVGSVVHEIARAQPKDQALAQVRGLLAERSTLARWIAIEALAQLGGAEDAPRIAALAKSRDKLTGYWGEGDDRPDPTLGARATELADKLSARAK